MALCCTQVPSLIQYAKKNRLNVRIGLESLQRELQCIVKSFFSPTLTYRTFLHTVKWSDKEGSPKITVQGALVCVIFCTLDLKGKKLVHKVSSGTPVNPFKMPMGRYKHAKGFQVNATVTIKPEPPYTQACYCQECWLFSLHNRSICSKIQRLENSPVPPWALFCWSWSSVVRVDEASCPENTNQAFPEMAVLHYLQDHPLLRHRWESVL